MKLVPDEIGAVRFAPWKSLWLWLNIAGGIAALVLGPELPAIAGAILLTFLTLCVGHSVGLHRGLIHETYRTSRRLRLGFVSLFVLTGLGSPLGWIRLHRLRDYWQNRADCPPYFGYDQSVIRDFWWNLHLRFEPSSLDRYALKPEDEDDPFLRNLDRSWWIWNLASFALFAVLFRFEVMLVLGPARVAGGILGHWFIGYWTHRHGEARFGIPGVAEQGTNSLLLGWISFGEGFHNNHHALPRSARMGITSVEFDLGWLVILALERCGLIRQVRSWSRGNVDCKGDVLVEPTARPLGVEP